MLAILRANTPKFDGILTGKFDFSYLFVRRDKSFVHRAASDVAEVVANSADIMTDQCREILVAVVKRPAHICYDHAYRTRLKVPVLSLIAADIIKLLDQHTAASRPVGRLRWDEVAAAWDDSTASVNCLCRTRTIKSS